VTVRSGRAQIGETLKKDVLEQTHDQKTKSDWSVNADPKSIGDPIVIEDRSKTIRRRLLFGPSDRRI
jgi:hypothetical protein